MIQLDALVLYNDDGDQRVVRFRPGRLNVISGESGTGKTSLIGILRFLLGGDSPHAPLGPIQRTVAWYGLSAHVDNTHFFIARPAPDHGSTTTQVALILGEALIPSMDSLSINANKDDLVEYLGDLLGISENLHIPAEGQTRRPLAANFRHSLYYCFQGQGEIANPEILFHRQNRDFQKQTIRDTMPYFLGAQSLDALRKREHLAELRRSVRRLTQKLRRALEVQELGIGLASTLLAEARSCGLLLENDQPTSAQEANTLLREILTSPVSELEPIDDGREFDSLVKRRQQVRDVLRRINTDLRGLDDFAHIGNEYDQELNEHRVRLASIGLVPDIAVSNATCPVCEATISQSRSHDEIIRRLGRVEKRLELSRKDRPRIENARASLITERNVMQSQLREVDQSLDALSLKAELRAAVSRSWDEQSFVRGRIAQYLDTSSIEDSEGIQALQRAIDSTSEAAESLSDELDPETLRSTVISLLAVVGHSMTKHARTLGLEHSDYSVRIDPYRLTVVADTLEGPAYMDAGEIGSGMSWVGYHLISYLALHEFFIANNRPVPRFIVIDQPSQAFFPRDRQTGGDLTELSDTDRENTRKLYRMMHETIVAHDGKLQIIAFDHADFSDAWFKDAVIETWREGEALIPPHWFSPSEARES